MKPDSPEASPSPVLDLLTRVFRGNGPFAAAICEGFDLGGADGPAETREAIRERELAAMLRRVAQEVARHPRRRLLHQFLVDQSRLKDAELVLLLEFIYSYLVNSFKGELAEVLSRVVVRNFVSVLEKMGELPPDAVVIEGGDIASWRLRQSGVDASWQKGADGLVAVPVEGGWAFHAIVEIKSYRQGLAKLAEQLTQHMERIRLGARIRGVPVDRQCCGFVERLPDGTRALVRLAAAEAPGSILKLAIRPRSDRRRARALEEVSQGFWLDELPDSTTDLHEAAYLLTAWYIARGVGELFQGAALSDEVPAGRPEDLYPELSPEEAGYECLKRGLYEAALRNTFGVRFADADAKKARKEKPPRSDEVFARLYNGICFGVEFMAADHLLTPEEYRETWNALAEKEGAPEAQSPAPQPFPADAKVSEAHSEFSRGAHEEATRCLEGLTDSELSPKQARTRKWLLGMIAFRDGRIEDALGAFPGPEGAPDRYWWTRDKLMLARLRARAGDGRGALAEIEAVTAENVARFRALSVERPAGQALAAHVAGDHEARDAALRSAEQALSELRAERAERAREERGMPIGVIVSSVHLGILDMLSTYAATGQADEAKALLNPVSGVGAWLKEFAALDPFVRAIRAEPKWTELEVLIEKGAAGAEAF